MSTLRNAQEDSYDKARLRYDLLKETLKYSENRENNYSNKFVEVEIQVASIIAGIVGASALLDKAETAPFKIFALGSAFLVASLLSGITAIHFLQKFWNGQMKINRQIFSIWRQYLIQDGGDYTQASNDCDKIAGSLSIVESPKWPHYLQTITLVIGLIILTYGVVEAVIKI